MTQQDCITQEILKQIVDYSADGTLRWKMSIGQRSKVGEIVGCVSTRYLRTRIFRKNYAIHRLVWLYHYGHFPKNNIDHINGNCFDNRIENLRECNQSENSQNRKRAKDNNSGFTGVSWHKNTKRWQANICIQRKQHYLGCYKTIDEAKNAYLCAKQKLHTFQPTLRELDE